MSRGAQLELRAAMEDAEDFTQVNISQAFQDAGAAVSLLPPNHNYNMARNSQDFGCKSQERGKVSAPLLTQSRPFVCLRLLQDDRCLNEGFYSTTFPH